MRRIAIVFCTLICCLLIIFAETRKRGEKLDFAWDGNKQQTASNGDIEEALALCRMFDGRYCSNKVVQMAMQMRTLPAWRKESWSNKALEQLKGYEQLFGGRNGVY